MKMGYQWAFNMLDVQWGAMGILMGISVGISYTNEVFMRYSWMN
jgi:hypothetical protein